MTEINVNQLPIISELKYSPLFINHDSAVYESNLIVGEWFLYYRDSFVESSELTIKDMIIFNESYDVTGTPFKDYNNNNRYWSYKESKERINNHILVVCGYEFDILYLDSHIMCLNSYRGAPVLCIKKEDADMFIKGNDDVVRYLSSKENDARNHYNYILKEISKKAPNFLSYFEALQIVGFILFSAFFYLVVKFDSILKGLAIVAIIFIVAFLVCYVLAFYGIRKWLKRLFLLKDHGRDSYFESYKSENDRLFVNKYRNLCLYDDDYMVVRQEIEKQSIIKIKGNIKAWKNKSFNPLNS